jgi:hypothetical protein
MNSSFANLFLALQTQISKGIPDIAYIDQDLGQLNSKTRPPVSWPCVLIDFEDFSFTNLSENVQTAEGIIVLRLGFAPHSNTTVATPPGNKEMALNYYDLEWQLHTLLQGWIPKGDEFGGLTRISAATQHRTDGYRVRELRYRIAFDDYSTKYKKGMAPATIIVTPQLDIQ